MSGIGRNRVWLPPVLPSCRAGCMRSLALVPFLSLFRVFGLPLFLPAFLFAPLSLLLFFVFPPSAFSCSCPGIYFPGAPALLGLYFPGEKIAEKEQVVLHGMAPIVVRVPSGTHDEFMRDVAVEQFFVQAQVYRV